MSDLASLLSVAPNSAAFMMGQQNNADLQGKDADRQRLMQLIQGLQQEQQQKAQMQPLMMEHQSLQNQGLQAGLPGIQGDSALKQANGAVAQGTVQSGIAAGNAKNDLTSTNDRAAIQQKLGDMYRELGVQSASVPPAARKGFVINGLKAAGMDPNSPDAQGLMQGLQNTPAEQLPEELHKLSIKINGIRDPNYGSHDLTSQRQKESAQYTADQHLKDVQGNNAATIQAAQIGADSRVEAANMRSQKTAADLTGRVLQNIQAAKGDAVKAHSIYLQAAQEARMNNDAAAADRWTQMAETVEKQAQSQIGASNAAKVDIRQATGGRMNTMPAPDISGSSGRTAPVTPVTNDLAAAVKAAGEEYRPDKFEYKIIGGVLHKKPKG